MPTCALRCVAPPAEPSPGRWELLHVSRLLRNRPAYQDRFGADAYEAMLANCLWGVYQMIGKLNPRVYTLRR